MLSTDVPCLNPYFEPYESQKPFFFTELGSLDQGCTFKVTLEEQENILEEYLEDIDLDGYTDVWGYNPFDWAESYHDTGNGQFFTKKRLNYIEYLTKENG